MLKHIDTYTIQQMPVLKYLYSLDNSYVQWLTNVYFILTDT